MPNKFELPCLNIYVAFKPKQAEGCCMKTGLQSMIQVAAGFDLVIANHQDLRKLFCMVQSIGFLGPAVALFGLNTVRDPVVATAWLTAAVGLSAFSQAGFLINYQVLIFPYIFVSHSNGVQKL